MVDKMGSDLSTSLATLLNPQILIKVNDDPNWLKTVKALTDVDYLLKLLLSLLFVLVFTIAVFLIFAGIFIMLLIRVVYLALLLIIMPIVWLAWIFPNTASYWKKWWNEFIRWTFFAPIMMLGMYLIVVTGQEMKNLQIFQNLSPEDLSYRKAFLGDLALDPGFFAHAAQIVIISGLLLGSLMLANKLSIIGGKETYGAAKGALRGAGGWAGRKGVRTAGWGFAQPSDRMKRWGAGGGIKGRIGKAALAIQNRGSRIPGLKKLGQAYRGKGQHANILAATWGGAKAGSGLFKGKEAGQWECQNMIGTPLAKCGNEMTSTKKPNTPCSKCGAIDWKKL